MITYQVERFREIIKEIEERTLNLMHWEEIALDQNVIPLDLDYGRYNDLDDAGQLHIVSVRSDGLVIGYHCSLVQTHLHYKNTLMAFTDLYYIMPEYRKGHVGRGLFKKVEETLKERGVVKMFVGSKCHQDHSKMFEYLGWKQTEILYTKVI